MYRGGLLLWVRWTRSSGVDHIDCDSIHTAGIMSGRLQPEARFGAAAAVQQRRERRARAAVLVAGGGFERAGEVWFARSTSAIDGEFFPALLPDAVLIMIASPQPGAPERWQVKLRLGGAAPDGLSLSTLGIGRIDPAHGGRWNAGSNRDRGGTALEPRAYARALAGLLDEALHAGRQAGRAAHATTSHYSAVSLSLFPSREVEIHSEGNRHGWRGAVQQSRLGDARAQRLGETMMDGDSDAPGNDASGGADHVLIRAAASGDVNTIRERVTAGAGLSRSRTANRFGTEIVGTRVPWLPASPSFCGTVNDRTRRLTILRPATRPRACSPDLCARAGTSAFPAHASRPPPA
jgi:hypothetical protein